MEFYLDSKTTSYVEMSEKIYDELERAVQTTYRNSCIVWIERNENKELEKSFLLYLAQFDNPNIKRLYHGTTKENINNILSNGFDPAKRKVCAFGEGIYFATRAEYSRHYSRKKINEDIAYMLVCDVVCGKVTKGRPGQHIPDRYQSFTNSIAKPDMYIVNKREAVFPRYVIAFYPDAK